MAARVSSLLRQAEELEGQWLDESLRFVDFAVQFVEVTRRKGELVATGRRSEVYGGRWDKQKIGISGRPGCFAGPAEHAVEIEVGPRQFEVLCDDAHHHLMVIGSRRSGKTELGAAWLVKQMARWPGYALSCLVQKHKKARKLLRDKVLPRVRQAWVASPPTYGDEVSLTLVTRTKVDFLSGRVPDDARGDGVPALFIDETQIIPQESKHNAKLSCSEGGTDFQTLEVGTATADFEDEVEAAKNNPDIRVEELSITDNVFLEMAYDDEVGAAVPPFVATMRRQMSQRQFEQEVGVWLPDEQRFSPRFHSLVGTVYSDFEVDTHARRWEDRVNVLREVFGEYPGLGRDITAQVARRRFRVAADTIWGVDWGINPMCGSGWRILQAPPGVPDIAWCVDEITIEDGGSPTKFGLELARRGYKPARTVVIADASDNKADSNRRLLQQRGFKVFWPGPNNRNPLEQDRINAVNAKILNGDEEPTLFVDPVKAPTTKNALRLQAWGPNKKPARDEHNHRAAGLGYFVIRLWPAAGSADRVLAKYAVKQAA